MVLSSNRFQLEKNILSSMLVHHEKLDVVGSLPKLDQVHFDKINAEIYTEMKECLETHGTIDPSLMPKTIDKHQAYCFELLDNHIISSNFEKYIDSVLELQQKGEIIKIISDKDGLDKTNPGDFVLEKIAKLEKVLEVPGLTEKEYLTGEEAQDNFLEFLEEEYDPMKHIKTGFKHLDEMLNLDRQDLWIVGARPSMGKTAFMLAVAKNLAKQGKRVGIFSLEMPTNALIARLYSSISSVRLSKIMNRELRGMLSEQEKGRLKMIPENCDWIGNNMFFFDRPSCDLAVLKNTVKKMKRKHNLDVILIDYLQFIQTDKEYQREDLRIAAITKELKNLIRSENVLGIVLAQLNRAVESRADRRPMKSDLDGSGEIEKTADLITLLYRDEYYNQESEQKGLMEIIIDKQRNGAVGTVTLRYFLEIQRIVDYTTNTVLADELAGAKKKVEEVSFDVENLPY